MQVHTTTDRDPCCNERREALVQFRITPSELIALKARAGSRRESIAEYARVLVMRQGAEAGLESLATRGDLKILADRMLHLESELQQIVRHINKLGDMLESAQLLSAASVASSAFLRVGPDDSDEQAKVVVKEHLQLAQNNAGAVVSFFNNR